ncbi:MAG: guanylate kinase [Patescibacteria group bacterium]|jgi:guanylate kinase
MHKLIILSGPGGCGKDTIIERLLKERNLKLSKLVNATSRPKREGEIDGENYHFVSKEQFQKMIENRDLLEYEVMSATGQFYGTLKNALENQLQKSDVVCNKMPVGALELKKYFSTDCITIFIDADDIELRQRLSESIRKNSTDDIEKRIEQGQKERVYANQFDYQLFNHDGELEKVVNEIIRIIS